MKFDLKKDRKDLYAPGSREFVEVVVPAMRYLAVDGAGDPNTSSAYADAVSSLYASAYAVKFGFKTRTADDFVVGPLEGLWWSEDPSSFVERRLDEWQWTMLIPLPEPVTDADVAAGLAVAARKKKDLPIDQVHLRTITEGLCLQILHLGAYADEGPTLRRLHEEVMPGRGVTFAGPHHEIYLGDPRRVAPEKLKTVLRQPVRPLDQ